MITVHLTGIGCRRLEVAGAAECARDWIKQAREIANEDPWLADTPDDMSILMALSSGGNMTGIQVAQFISRPKATIRTKILTLCRRGWVRMVGRGGWGGGKVWEITPAGHDAIQDMKGCQPRTKGD